LLDKDSSAEWTAVLTDFGITRVVSDKTKLVGAFKFSQMEGASLSYAAPEILLRFKSAQDDPISSGNEFKSIDVFSVGAVLHEAITREVPWKTINDIDSLLKLIYEGKRPKVGAKAKEWVDIDQGFELLIDLMRDCWDTEAKKRPPMKSVHAILKKHLN
jgi:serine/threonine protein kinase